MTDVDIMVSLVIIYPTLKGKAYAENVSYLNRVTEFHHVSNLLKELCPEIIQR